MSTSNKKRISTPLSNVRLAGGAGAFAAVQGAEALLRRNVMTCLLWEDIAYMDGTSVAESISSLIPQVNPTIVATIAIEARNVQKLRHVPLFIAREMLKYASHRPHVAFVLANVINRPDEMTEFLALYWADNGKKTLAAQAKKGLSAAFTKFNEYQLAKWDNDKKEVRLRDVLRLCRPKPDSQAQAELWKRVVNGTLATPDTWEVALSAGADKKATWERLISENRLGAFAFLKNLRNMQQAGVKPSIIREGLLKLNPAMLLPMDFLKAQKYALDYTRELEQAMFNCLGSYGKLPGHTIFVTDVSGSMRNKISDKSEFNRMDVGAAMTILASEMCESVSIYATAGSDGMQVHQTAKVKPYRGFALSEEILKMASNLGGGGIFTRQCLEYIKTQEKEQPDRIIVFSDSQDCDRRNPIPNPFGKKNYIIDVNAHTHGVNYRGRWTAEISGWSEAFLGFIQNLEQSNNQ